jgi:hypothetical protein
MTVRNVSVPVDPRRRGGGIVATVTSSSTPSLSKGEVFDVLRNQRRRLVLQYLKRSETSVELGELATQVAAWEYETTCDEVSAEQRKRVYTTLQQTHLPRLADANIVHYDAEEGRISATDRATDIAIYLEIVPGNELPWREIYLSMGAVAIALCVAVWASVFPFDALSGVQWAFVISIAFTITAAVHVYHERNMRLADLESPPVAEEAE